VSSGHAAATRWRRDVALLLTICVLFALINVRWVLLYRHDQPYDTDEASYLNVSLVYFRTLVESGFGSWIGTIQSFSPAAPLATALSSLAYVLVGPQPLAGFAVVLLFGIITIAASYSLGTVIGGRRLGLLACLLVASSPIILNYARSFHFALPATAVTTVALLALARADNLANLRWALLFGVSVGLMPLSRTMTIAFVPGLIIAAFLQASIQSDRRARRVGVLLLSLTAGTLTAAVWLLPNGARVFGYLVNFGYGAQSVHYGPSQRSMWDWQAFVFHLRLIAADVYLPYTLFIVAGFGVLFFLLTRTLHRVGLKETVYTIINSKLFPSAVLVVQGTVALVSSQNKGTAFIAPLVPAMLLLSVWSLLKIRQSLGWHRLVTSVSMAIGLVSLAPLLDLDSALARPWHVDVPLLGLTTVSDGRGTIQKYAADGGYSTHDPAVPVSRSAGAEWVTYSALTADKLAAATQNGSAVAFGFRHYLYNINTINLARLRSGASPLPLMQIEPDEADGSSGDVAELLPTGKRSVCWLLTSAGTIGEMRPAVNDASIESAARSTGFVSVEQWALPDDRTVQLWARRNGGCGVANVQPGDRWGQVHVVAADELFVHPGESTATRFEVAIDGKWSAVTLSIPAEVLQSCPDADGVNVAMQDQSAWRWSGIVPAGHPAVVPLPRERGGVITLSVENNRQAHCDHLYVTFARSP
jgi:4-amino-4-deoxy-L-arabinose transferase-like glycosyltransferase